jgi:hypothetical protein
VENFCGKKTRPVREEEQAEKELRFDQSLQFDLAFEDFHDVFDIVAIFLFLQVFGLLHHEFVETGARELACGFAGFLLGL